jgi:hypothetical protein
VSLRALAAGENDGCMTAEGARALARVRQEVVRVEEEGLRLAEELSEDRLSQGWWVSLMLTRCYPLVTHTEAREVLERVNTPPTGVNPLCINTSLVTCWSHICPLVRHWCKSVLRLFGSVGLQTSSGSLRSPTSTPSRVPDAASYGRAGLFTVAFLLTCLTMCSILGVR